MIIAIDRVNSDQNMEKKQTVKKKRRNLATPDLHRT